MIFQIIGIAAFLFILTIVEVICFKYFIIDYLKKISKSNSNADSGLLLLFLFLLLISSAALIFAYFYVGAAAFPQVIAILGAI